MEQLSLFSAEKQPLRPNPARAEPALWVARVLILREPRVAEDTVIQDIRLRRGLNILWAPPTLSQADAEPPANRLTGHSAGKTTFCRMIRYLLGETRFGTTRTQDRIRDKLESGWVVGEIFVAGERWTVGRPFARGIHPFAARGVGAEGALEASGGYQDFLAAVAAAVTADLPVKMLPHARSPIAWELVLAWLARDQEARFADLLDWRAPSSESESPNPIAADRSVVVRALLDLMSDEESDLQQRTEALTQKRNEIRGGVPFLEARAAEDRRRLAALLGVAEDQAGAGPLFIDRWLEARRSALDGLEKELAGKAAAVAQAQDERARASEDVGALGERLRELEDRLARHRARSLEAPEGLGADGAPTIARLEGEIAAARGELAEAEARRAERLAEAVRLSAALEEERAGLYRGRAALTEIERFERYAEETRAALDDIEIGARRLTEELAKLAERKTARRREHAEARERLERRFDEVVRALLGALFMGRVNLVRGQIELQVADRGERTGAAMETIKLLAFDLAALALRIEGHGSFPGFLIHDGPREADLAEGIYEQLFRYSADLEKKLPGQAEPAFQYIVTTTGAPPEELRRGPWLLSPTLDASRPEGRLLKEDL
jgi:hypothetical protein